MATVLIQGSGDVGSGIAHLLFRSGYPVVLHDEAHPSHTRRRMAFTDAFYDGQVELEGVIAKRLPALECLPIMLDCHRAVPTTAELLDQVLPIVHPEVIVDARMRKRCVPEPNRGSAPLTIGIGPGFVAGVNVDLAVESAWGESLGHIIREGATLSLAGEPRPIAGLGRERFVYSPLKGTFITQRAIGEHVEAGEVVGTIDGNSPVLAPLAGRIRGLSHTGALVNSGAKVLEVVLTDDAETWRGLGERPRRIAEGVLAAIDHLPPS